MKYIINFFLAGANFDKKYFQWIEFLLSFLFLIFLLLTLSLSVHCLSMENIVSTSNIVIVVGVIIISFIGAYIQATRYIWVRNCSDGFGGMYPPVLITVALLSFIFSLFLIFGCVT